MNLGKIGWVCMPGENKRIDYIDFMNIYACFSVICMHCSGSVFEYGMTENRLFLLCLFVQMIAHPAIPVFFMITGTTLLEYRKKYDTKTFFRKRVMRTVFPFVFWTFFICSARSGWMALHFRISGNLSQHYPITRGQAYSGFSMFCLLFICACLSFL